MAIRVGKSTEPPKKPGCLSLDGRGVGEGEPSCHSRASGNLTPPATKSPCLIGTYVLLSPCGKLSGQQEYSLILPPVIRRPVCLFESVCFMHINNCFERYLHCFEIISVIVFLKNPEKETKTNTPG